MMVKNDALLWLERAIIFTIAFFVAVLFVAVPEHMQKSNLEADVALLEAEVAGLDSYRANCDASFYPALSECEDRAEWLFTAYTNADGRAAMCEMKGWMNETCLADLNDCFVRLDEYRACSVTCAPGVAPPDGR